MKRQLSTTSYWWTTYEANRTTTTDGTSSHTMGLCEIATAYSVWKLQGLGLANSSLLKRKKKEDGIRESVHLMSSADTTWHRPFTTGAIEKLRLYKRKFNKYTGDYEGPQHDSNSHFSDSFAIAQTLLNSTLTLRESS